MKELVIKDNNIENMIYEVRGKQVMLDSDLARLYQCKNGTKEINQAVKNNIDKFPERFSWKLTNDEFNDLRSKKLTTNYSSMSRSLPRAFTEQGVSMLATIIKSKVATQVSIQIMDAFVVMKKYISCNLLEQKYINNLVLENHEKIIENSSDIKDLQESIETIIKKRIETDIYFSGQIYDAYSTILDIFKSAKKELIVVDNYADNTLLDIIKKLKINVIVITKKDNLLTKELINRYKKQYSNLKVIFNDTFHDRYFILDNNTIYHCGASINRIGYKTFSINLISDDIAKNLLIKEIKKLI